MPQPEVSCRVDGLDSDTMDPILSMQDLENTVFRLKAVLSERNHISVLEPFFQQPLVIEIMLPSEWFAYQGYPISIIFT